MKLPTIQPGLVGKIVKNRPLSEPIIRLQDLEDTARLKHKKITIYRNFNLISNSW